jgi:hypothetical protein
MFPWKFKMIQNYQFKKTTKKIVFLFIIVFFLFNRKLTITVINQCKVLFSKFFVYTREQIKK